MMLRSQTVITAAEAQEIESQPSSYAKNFALYMSLFRKIKTQAPWELLLNALTKSGNNHIIRMLYKAQTLKSDDPTLTNQPKIFFNVQDPVCSFTGRNTFLEKLHGALTTELNESPRQRITVLSGLGGSGKTETVRKYIHQYGHCYDHVVWIDAEDSYTLENQIKELAVQSLGISSQDKDNKLNFFHDLLTKVYTKLCSQRCVPLIIFDNAESLNNSDCHEDGIWSFLPQSHFLQETQPVILITSRSRNWKFEWCTVMELGILTEYESRELVLRQLELERNAKNSQDADSLCQILDRFPMLIQAAVAMFRDKEQRKHLFGNESYFLQEFISELMKEKTSIFLQSPPESSHIVTMSQIWSSTLEKIQKYKEGELAIRVLNLLPYLHPTSIPQELMRVLLAEEDDCISKSLNLLENYLLIECSVDNDESFCTRSITQRAHLVHLKLKVGKEKQILLRMTRKFKTVWMSLQYPSKLYENVTRHILYFSSYLEQNFNDSFLEFTRFVLGKSLTMVPEGGKTNDIGRFEKTLLNEIPLYPSQEPIQIFDPLTYYPKRSARQKAARKVNLKKAKSGKFSISQGFQETDKKANETGNTILRENEGLFNYIY